MRVPTLNSRADVSTYNFRWAVPKFGALTEAFNALPGRQFPLCNPDRPKSLGGSYAT